MPKLTLYAAHLQHNYKVLCDRLQTGTTLIPVIKANAYGSCAIQVAKHLTANGANRLAVAFTQEGIALRQAGVQNPIMVFYPQRNQFKNLVEAQLEPVLYRQADMEYFAHCLSPEQSEYPIHLKFNTGLNRIGFSTTTDEVCRVLETLSRLPFQLISVYTHLCATEDSRPQAYLNQQINRFEKVQQQLLSQLDRPPMFHLLNTSGIFNYPEFHADAVRSGIGLHGFANRPEWDADLKPVAELKAEICQITKVAKGEYVGYNFGWQAPKNSRVATLPIGHADGIGRHFGNGKAHVFFGAQKAPIIGNICMDLLMVDVTELKVKEGDELCFFGPDNSADLWAQGGKTIAYELLTGLGPRIEREWID